MGKSSGDNEERSNSSEDVFVVIGLWLLETAPAGATRRDTGATAAE